MTTRNLTCRELDERLGDYLERSLDDSTVADIELHLSGCPSCAALVRDFESITRQAATLPPLTPTRDLWAGIEARIGTPVVSLDAHAASRPASRRSTWQHMRTGAIAAGLMGITAVVTYTMTRQHDASSVANRSAIANVTGDSAPSTAIAQRPDSTATRVSPSAPNATSPNAASPDAPTTQGSTLASAQNAGVSGANPTNAIAPTVGSALVARRESRPSPTVTYDAEISSLRDVLSERSEQLDPRTVAVLQSSIATIDSAIVQARAALQRDPASRFLSTQLDKALEKKLGLLRTAALLPARS